MPLQSNTGFGILLLMIGIWSAISHLIANDLREHKTYQLSVKCKEVISIFDVSIGRFGSSSVDPNPARRKKRRTLENSIQNIHNDLKIMKTISKMTYYLALTLCLAGIATTGCSMRKKDPQNRTPEHQPNITADG
jgi:hypothetical protein